VRSIVVPDLPFLLLHVLPEAFAFYHGADRRPGFVSSGRWAFQKLVLRLRRRTKAGWWRVEASPMTTGVHAVLISSAAPLMVLAHRHPPPPWVDQALTSPRSWTIRRSVLGR
jgi:hypothetical protein